MSRLAKKPITISEDVKINIEPRRITITGQKGELGFDKKSYIDFEMLEGGLKVSCKKSSPRIRALLGLYVALTKNCIQGVTEGFEKQLEFNGVGFRVVADNSQQLTLNLGFSHPIVFNAPEGIELAVEKNIITVTGIDKALVGQAAANIRDLKKPEPYKGKGIRYIDEIVRRKPGKMVAKVTEGAE